MIILLMILTGLVTLAFFCVLIYFLAAITGRLEAIGRGSGSALGRINAAFRSVEGHTSFIEPELTKLNTGLGGARTGLDAIDEGLVAIAGAAVVQEKYR